MFNHGDMLYLHGLTDKSLSFQNILYIENSVSYLLNAMLQILGGLKLNREASIYYKFYLKDWFSTKHYPQRRLWIQYDLKRSGSLFMIVLQTHIHSYKIF